MSLEASVLAGAASSLAIASPVEWAIHKYLLHAKKRNKLTRVPAFAHNDVHHAGYKGPHHYYQDVTNEDIVIHFSPKDVGLIAGISLGVGAAISAGYHSIASSGKPIGLEDVALAGGVVAGTMLYYSAYEITHHYMHVIGMRRISINHELGNALQGKYPDGQLRFSKPLLDDICNEVESNIDRNLNKSYITYSFTPELVDRLDRQIKHNAEREQFGKLINPNLAGVPAREALYIATDFVYSMEKEIISELGALGSIKYWADRKIQKALRTSKAFEYIDNHHFIHHYRYLKNLNVVLPLADKLFGTKIDSSREMLERDTNFWLCPNTTDTKKFELKRSV